MKIYVKTFENKTRGHIWHYEYPWAQNKNFWWLHDNFSSTQRAWSKTGRTIKSFGRYRLHVQRLMFWHKENIFFQLKILIYDKSIQLLN